jgi:cellulose synthase/poly-beta-1,6-N-acetylglucosamine synthase-like glycosyltransferase
MNAAVSGGSILFIITAALIAYAYKGFDVLLSLLVALRGGPGLLRDKTIEPTVTIFIPAYNEEKVIAAKIENCLALDYPPEKLEIMVCSDCSSDRTVEKTRKYLARGITLFDYRERGGKAGLINKSLPRAKGEIVVLTDANTMFAPDAVRAMVGLYTSDTVGAVLGEVKLSVPPGGRGVGKEVAYRDAEAKLKYKEGLFGASIGGFGGFYSIRKTLFTPLPANAYSNDDLLIAVRILARGLRVVFDPTAVSHEETGLSVAEEFKRRVRIGAGNFQAFFMLFALLNPLRGWAFLFYMSHKVLRWFSPFLLCALFIVNIALVNIQFFKILFVCQCAFYAIAALGILTGRLKIVVPGVSAIHHFVWMNIAVFFGFFRCIRGIKSATWESTQRSQG